MLFSEIVLIYLIQIIIVFGTIVNKVYIYCALLINILLLLIVNKCKDFTYKIILKSLPSKPTLQIDIELLPVTVVVITGIKSYFSIRYLN